MDKQFNDLFDLRCEDDASYYKKIPNIDVSILREVLERDFKSVNSAENTLDVWARFKNHLLNYEKEWKICVFKWGANPEGKYPYAHIEINWEALENKPTRYFQVHMAVEDVFMADGSELADIWEAIDNA